MGVASYIAQGHHRDIAKNCKGIQLKINSITFLGQKPLQQSCVQGKWESIVKLMGRPRSLRIVTDSKWQSVELHSSCKDHSHSKWESIVKIMGVASYIAQGLHLVEGYVSIARSLRIARESDWQSAEFRSSCRNHCTKAVHQVSGNRLWSWWEGRDR